MLLWILSPKNIFHGERLPCTRKILFCSVIAFVYTFSYINLIEVNHREKMVWTYLYDSLRKNILEFLSIICDKQLNN